MGRRNGEEMGAGEGGGNACGPRPSRAANCDWWLQQLHWAPAAAALRCTFLDCHHWRCGDAWMALLIILRAVEVVRLEHHSTAVHRNTSCKAHARPPGHSGRRLRSFVATSPARKDRVSIGWSKHAHIRRCAAVGGRVRHGEAATWHRWRRLLHHAVSYFRVRRRLPRCLR
jgi:hypothetical protein